MSGGAAEISLWRLARMFYSKSFRFVPAAPSPLLPPRRGRSLQRACGSNFSPRHELTRPAPGKPPPIQKKERPIDLRAVKPTPRIPSGRDGAATCVAGRGPGAPASWAIPGQRPVCWPPGWRHQRRAACHYNPETPGPPGRRPNRGRAIAKHLPRFLVGRCASCRSRRWGASKTTAPRSALPAEALPDADAQCAPNRHHRAQVKSPTRAPLDRWCSRSRMKTTSASGGQSRAASIDRQ